MPVAGCLQGFVISHVRFRLFNVPCMFCLQRRILFIVDRFCQLHQFLKRQSNIERRFNTFAFSLDAGATEGCDTVGALPVGVAACLVKAAVAADCVWEVDAVGFAGVETETACFAGVVAAIGCFAGIGTGCLTGTGAVGCFAGVGTTSGCFGAACEATGCFVGVASWFVAACGCFPAGVEVCPGDWIAAVKGVACLIAGAWETPVDFGCGAGSTWGGFGEVGVLSIQITINYVRYLTREVATAGWVGGCVEGWNDLAE